MPSIRPIATISLFGCQRNIPRPDEQEASATMLTFVNDEEMSVHDCKT
jgi:hypothetical protein